MEPARCCEFVALNSLGLGRATRLISAQTGHRTVHAIWRMYCWQVLGVNVVGCSVMLVPSAASRTASAPSVASDMHAAFRRTCIWLTTAAAAAAAESSTAKICSGRAGWKNWHRVTELRVSVGMKHERVMLSACASVRACVCACRALIYAPSYAHAQCSWRGIIKNRLLTSLLLDGFCWRDAVGDFYTE